MSRYESENLACWAINGTYCGGKQQGTWQEKRENCSKCEVFCHAIHDELDELGDGFNLLLEEIKVIVSAVTNSSVSIASAAEEMHLQ